MQEDSPATHDQAGLPSARLSDAVSVARDLMHRLAGDLDVAVPDEPARAVLRDAYEVLLKLSVKKAAAETITSTSSDPASVLVLDVSDLIGYFENNRLPTGIQRVQTELIFNLLTSQRNDAAKLCCFVVDRNQWVEVNSALFVDICNQSREGGDALEPRWLAAISQMRAAIKVGSAMAFPRRSVLMNVGTSWWLPNYFLYVRTARQTSDVRYIPLIYDLIPALTPENCDPRLVQEFIGWFIGVLDHADYFLAISEATRKDLMDFAARLGRPISADRIVVVALDADFRAAEGRPVPLERRFAERFVLFVSTLEARKNQLGALDAWAALIAQYGAAKVPRLVLVGKRGFKSDLILNKLSSNVDLQQCVTILSGIEDVELQALYRDCLFTIYPSFYEGWGLPVTESLCYGKVPLIADNSSLPEAGGSSALYFRTGSTKALVSALERLIMDDEFRQCQEAIIHQSFRPRRWADIADGVADQIKHWTALPEAARWKAPEVQSGMYYPLRRNQSARVWHGMGSAEQFRSGLGWHRLEDQGCWTLPAGAELEMRLATPNIRRIGFEIFCSERSKVRFQISVVGHDTQIDGGIEHGGTKWAFLDLPDKFNDTMLRVRFSTIVLSEPELGWNGDYRSLGIGVRGFFVFAADIDMRMDFLEAVALGALSDLNFYRDRSCES